MTCDDVRAAYLAGDGARPTEAHLATCVPCRALIPEMDRLRRHLDHPSQWAVPDVELEGRVVDAVVDGTRSSTSRRSSPARRWGLLGAAAAAIAIVVVGALVTFLRPAGPDWELALAPTSSAPGASAIVQGWNEESGTRMTFDVTGLEPVDDDAYYAIWLTSSDGRHVPAGTFRSSGEVTAWAAVRRRDFPRIWITLEANDDDESLSGRTVLDLPS